MTPVPFRIVPHEAVIGIGPRWTATSDEPWLELQVDVPLAGRCVRLDWSAGHLDPVCRPVVRCVLGDRTEDIVLAGASFGRSSWTGRIPQDTQTILISPVHVAGPFGFRIDRLMRLSFVEMMWRALCRRPVNAILSMTARARGWTQASESELRETFMSTDLVHYDLWRRERLRSFEPEIDAVPLPASAPKAICCVLMLDEIDERAVKRVITTLSHEAVSDWRLYVAVPPEHLAGNAGRFQKHERLRLVSDQTPVSTFVSELPSDGFLHVLHRDAELSPTFARLIAQVAATSPDAVLIYGDEDRVTATGRHCRPWFKGDFDPLLAQSLDFIGATGVWRVDGLRHHLDAATRMNAIQDALICLAATLSTEQVHHVARVLVTLPEREPVGAAMPVAPPPPHVPSVSPVAIGPFISVIIPTRDRLQLLKPCVDSLFQFARRPIELVIVDNGSAEPETLTYFDLLRRRHNATIVRVDAPFNFSDLCNRGAAVATSQRLLFLNNDTAFFSDSWETIIAPYLDDPTIGAVGAKLLYRDGRVQHSGVIVGLHGRSGHFEIGAAHDATGYFLRMNRAHTLLAVTGACLAVRRDHFEAVGGFDAGHLPVDLNDIDFCLRLVERGWKTIYLPQWTLFHDESATRGRLAESDRVYGGERRYFSQRWLRAIRHDPAFNPNLSLWKTQVALG
jgi:GT2 family glycosyltransferase